MSWIYNTVLWWLGSYHTFFVDGCRNRKCSGKNFLANSFDTSQAGWCQQGDPQLEFSRIQYWSTEILGVCGCLLMLIGCGDVIWTWYDCFMKKVEVEMFSVCYKMRAHASQVTYFMCRRLLLPSLQAFYIKGIFFLHQVHKKPDCRRMEGALIANDP